MSAPGGLGRVESFDPRNLAHLIADRIIDDAAGARAALAVSRAARVGAAVTPDVPDSALPAREVVLADAPSTIQHARSGTYYWDSAWHGDQGQTPRCTAFAALHLLADGPVTHPGQNPVVDPDELYRTNVAIDRVEGRVFGEGATSLAMAKNLQRRQLIGEYLWGYSLADFVTAMKTGPVLLGLNWYAGLSEPDHATGIVRASGAIEGGHEIIANGLNLSTGLVRLKNSWGRDWGKGGHCYLPLEDLEWLIADGGDVCTVRELPTRRAA